MRNHIELGMYALVHWCTHHLLCSDSDGLGELHHGGLVIYEGALRFRRRSFIHL